MVYLKIDGSFFPMSCGYHLAEFFTFIHYLYVASSRSVTNMTLWDSQTLFTLVLSAPPRYIYVCVRVFL